jgi:hypothetical protein
MMCLECTRSLVHPPIAEEADGICSLCHAEAPQVVALTQQWMKEGGRDVRELARRIADLRSKSLATLFLSGRGS